MANRADFAFDGESPQHFGLEAALTYIWDVPTLSWVKNTGAGPASVAITIANGADVAEGATTDAAAPSGNGSVIALLKAIRDVSVGPSAATVTSPSVGAGSTQILAANTSRKRYIVTNEHASQDLYIKEGTTASTTSYTWIAQFGGGVIVSPTPGYTGVLEAIYSGGGTQACRVTEEI